MKPSLDAYEKEKTEMSETDVYGVRKNEMNAPFIALQLYVGVWRYSGDYARRPLQTGYGLAVDFHITPVVALQVNGGVGTLPGGDAFTTPISTLNVSLLFRLLPFQRITPLVSAGGGFVSQRATNPFQLRGTRYGEAMGGLGLQYTPAKAFSFRTMLEYHQPFTDNLDGRVAGTHNDYYLRASLGLVLNLGRFTPPQSRRVAPAQSRPVAPPQAAPVAPAAKP